MMMSASPVTASARTRLRRTLYSFAAADAPVGGGWAVAIPLARVPRPSNFYASFPTEPTRTPTRTPPLLTTSGRALSCPCARVPLASTLNDTLPLPTATTPQATLVPDSTACSPLSLAVGRALQRNAHASVAGGGREGASSHQLGAHTPPTSPKAAADAPPTADGPTPLEKKRRVTGGGRRGGGRGGGAPLSLALTPWPPGAS